MEQEEKKLVGWGHVLFEEKELCEKLGLKDEVGIHEVITEKAAGVTPDKPRRVFHFLVVSPELTGKMTNIPDIELKEVQK